LSLQLNNNEDDDGDDIVADINMTPLIDIMLVLLIIFMVTSSVSLESGLDIEIPKTTSQTKKQEGSALIISLDGKGVVRLQGKAVDNNEIKAQIAKQLAQEKTQEVIFEGDTQSTLGKMIELMDLAKEAGATKFSVAAKEEK
jgi:biopolymer transport protein ExbD